MGSSMETPRTLSFSKLLEEQIATFQERLICECNHLRSYREGILLNENARLKEDISCLRVKLGQGEAENDLLAHWAAPRMPCVEGDLSPRVCLSPDCSPVCSTSFDETSKTRCQDHKSTGSSQGQKEAQQPGMRSLSSFASY